jgi:hypothetical protein
MQLITITLFGILSLAIATPVKRTPAAIESAIVTVNADLVHLDSDIDSFSGGFFQELALAIDFNKLDTDFTTLSSAVTSTGPLALSDSTTIATGVNTLVTTLCGALVDGAAKVGEVSSNWRSKLGH